METIYDQLSVPIPERYHWLLAGVWQKIEDFRQKIEVLQGNLMQKVVLQAAKHEEDAKVQSEGKSSSQDPENKQPMNISEIVEKPRDVKGHQSGGRVDSFTGSRLRSTATKNISDNANTKGYGHYLLIALAFCTWPPGAYGNGNPGRYYTRINQSVNLPAGAKVEDFVEWFLSPAQNSTEYISLYDSGDSGEIPRKDGCGGYHFGLNHSIFIASAQPCHAGTYIVDIRDVDSRTMDLIVDGVAENSTERVNENGTLIHSTQTPALNTESKSYDFVRLAMVLATCFAVIALVAIIVAFIQLYRTGKCKRILSKVSPAGNKNDAKYDQVRSNESA